MPVYDFTLGPGEFIVIGDTKLCVDKVPSQTQCRLGMKAPKHVSICRKEILKTQKLQKCAKAEAKIKRKLLQRES